MSDVTYEAMYAIDLIITIILKVIGILCLCLWVILRKGEINGN